MVYILPQTQSVPNVSLSLPLLTSHPGIQTGAKCPLLEQRLSVIRDWSVTSDPGL